MSRIIRVEVFQVDLKPHVQRGGAQKKVPIYDTEGGWPHFPIAQVVDNALANQACGFRGVKIKVGKPHVIDQPADCSRRVALFDQPFPRIHAARPKRPVWASIGWKAIDRLRVAPPTVLQTSASNASKRRAK